MILGLRLGLGLLCLSLRLGLGVGSRMVLTAADADGAIQGQLVRVVGLFASGLEALDEG